MYNLLVFLLLLLLPVPTFSACKGKRQFLLKFNFDWSSATDPQFPNSDPLVQPGYSPIICVTHRPSYSLWTEGKVASEIFIQYMDSVDRDRAPEELYAALNQSKTDGDIYEIIIDPPLETLNPLNIPATGDAMFNITVNAPAVARLTCVSRIIPSPDWFIGFSAMAMCDNSNKSEPVFLTERNMVLEPWDAGFDDAREYETKERLVNGVQRVIRPLLGVSSSGYGVLNITQSLKTKLPKKDDNQCFAGSQLVWTPGKPVPMNELHIGQLVRAAHRDAIYTFSHRQRNIYATFLQLSFLTPHNQTANIRLTPGHYIHTPSSLVPAKEVRVGTYLVWHDNTPVPVVDVQWVQDWGLYNPHTTSGELIVAGIKVSCYTTSIEPVVANALLIPIRAFGAGKLFDWVTSSGLRLRR